MQTLWSLKQRTRGSLRISLSLNFSMMKPVHWAGLKLRGLMDHWLRLVFRQVPQSICLYCLRTKPDIWVHLTYRAAHSFIIWAHPDWRWVIAGFHSVLWKKLMEKNGLLKLEYGHFITVKCLQHEDDYHKKVRACENFSGWMSAMFHSFNSSERKKWFSSAATEGQHCQAIN